MMLQHKGFFDDRDNVLLRQVSRGALRRPKILAHKTCTLLGNLTCNPSTPPQSQQGDYDFHCEEIVVSI